MTQPHMPAGLQEKIDELYEDMALLISHVSSGGDAYQAQLAFKVWEIKSLMRGWAPHLLDEAPDIVRNASDPLRYMRRPG